MSRATRPTPPDRQSAPGRAFFVAVTGFGSKKNTYGIGRRKRGGGRGIFLSARAKAVQKRLIDEISAAWLLRPPTDRKPFEYPISIRLTLAKNAKMDVDNAAGHPLDCLVKCGVLRDDGRKDVVRLIVERDIADTNTIHVREIRP